MASPADEIGKEVPHCPRDNMLSAEIDKYRIMRYNSMVYAGDALLHKPAQALDKTVKNKYNSYV